MKLRATLFKRYPGAIVLAIRERKTGRKLLQPEFHIIEMRSFESIKQRNHSRCISTY